MTEEKSKIMKILIVDDEAPIREWLKLTIESLDFNCEVIGLARNGQEAMELYIEYMPDVIFMDIIMPGVNGIDFLAKIREREEKRIVFVLSNYDDFEYARSVFMLNIDGYILKTEITKEELMNMLRKAEAKIEKERAALSESDKLEMLADYFTDAERQISEGDGDEIRDLLKKMNVPLDSQNYFVICVKQYSTKNLRRAQALPEKNGISNVFSFWIKGVYVIFANIQKSVSEMIQQHCLAEYVMIIQRHFRRPIGVSNIHNGYANMKTAFSEGQAALDQSFFSIKEVFWYSPRAVDNAKDDALTALKTEFYNSLNSQSEDKIAACIRNMLDYIRQSDDINSEIAKRFSADLLCELYINQNNNYGNIIKNIEWLNKEISEIDNYDTLCHLIFEQLDKYIQKRINSSYSQHIQKAVLYIEKNFANLSNMMELAEHVGLNYDYFCRLFSDEVGMSFSKYLTQTRINHALQYLKSCNCSISEVARLIGYSDVRYFSKIFRKMMGMSPYKFRNTR